MALNNEGAFVVSLSCGHDAKAELTGKHFDDDDLLMARQYVNRENSNAMSGRRLYLVGDGAVAFAVASMERFVGAGGSGCVSGKRGKPCGVCDECLEAKRGAFTRAILGSVELPKCELANRLFEAVSGTVGMTTVRDWNGFCGDVDVSEIMEKTRKMEEKK